MLRKRVQNMILRRCNRISFTMHAPCLIMYYNSCDVEAADAAALDAVFATLNPRHHCMSTQTFSARKVEFVAVKLLRYFLWKRSVIRVKNSGSLSPPAMMSPTFSCSIQVSSSTWQRAQLCFFVWLFRIRPEPEEEAEIASPSPYRISASSSFVREFCSRWETILQQINSP